MANDRLKDREMVPSSADERRQYLKAVLERIQEICEKNRYEEFLARCSQLGLSRKMIGRWLNTPDMAPRVESLRLAASALLDVGFPLNGVFDRAVTIDKRRAGRVARAREIVDVVDRALKTEFLGKEKTSRVTILMADLVNSTAFKHHASDLEWLKKTRLHNRVAEDCVKAVTGRVIKFLGDGVLAEFEGKEHEQRAIRAGLAIIEAIEVQSKRRQRDVANRLETAVGVASGKVYWFTFEQSKEPEPQGSIVDLAARLCGLAGPQQLISSRECFNDAGGLDAFPNSSEESARFVKGFDDAVQLRLVLPDGRECRKEDIRHAGHSRDTKPENIELLNRARQLLLGREVGWFEEAKRSFRLLLQKEPGNFEANFRLGQLLLAEVNEDGKKIPENLAEATKHLCMAKQVNPDSWRVWLLVSNAWRCKFEATQDYADLDNAVGRAEEAIEKAEKFMDSDGIHRSKLELAELLWARSRDSKRDGALELAKAAVLCDDIHDAFNGVQARRRSDCLVTTALVALSMGSKPRAKIEEMLRKAVEIAPGNSRALRALATFLDSGGGGVLATA